MKGTEQFKTVIQNYLNDLASKDSLFAQTLQKANKSIDECINYILHEVARSGCNGFADEEIFNMAVHYYDEDDIKSVKPMNTKVVVNHTDTQSKGDKKPPQPKSTKAVKTRSKVVQIKPDNQVSLFDFPGV